MTMALLGEEYSQIAEAIVSAMKRGGVIALYENPDDYNLIMSNPSVPDSFDLAVDIAESLGLKLLNVPNGVSPELYIFPSSSDSIFAMTREDLNKKIVEFIPAAELRKNDQTPRVLISMLFFHLIKSLFSSDLEPECIKTPEVTFAAYLNEVDSYMQKVAALADQSDDPTASSVGAAARFFGNFPKGSVDDVTEEKTRNSTRAGILKSLMRFLVSVGYIEKNAWNRGSVAPTGRFACFYMVDVASTAQRAGIEEILLKASERN